MFKGMHLSPSLFMCVYMHAYKYVCKDICVCTCVQCTCVDVHMCIVLTCPCIYVCLSRGFYTCTKYYHQEASWGGKGLFSLHFHIAVHHQRKSGLELKQVRKQELMQRPWRDVTYWLASPGLLSLLFYRTKTTSPGMVPPTRGLSPLITN